MKRFASPQRVTIADVARVADVSKTTVSHVLSGKRPVALPTRARVETAIQELGYRPDGLARSLRTRRTHMVALVIPDITNPYYPLLARGLEDGMVGGYRTFICNSDGHSEREQEFLAEVADRRADGIVLDSFTMGADWIEAVVPEGMPVVRIGTTVADDPGYDTVHADDEHGAHRATTHLMGKGHRRVGMIQGPAGAGGKRNDGYLRALHEAGVAVDPELVVSGEWTRPGGAVAARRLLGLADPPTAVFCANDLMALGAMDAARGLGLEIPRDLALVGFDDIEAAAMVSPPLTTVSNLAYETGLMAGVLLRERMTGQFRGAPRTVTLPCKLVERATT
ncbi:MAG TPA: LacI family DNA-binding transcriptional regulator [Actinomycetota bacterium]|nr:LacI family DNA-binding transcriptional regulator [Actinomycetota bacterium]